MKAGTDKKKTVGATGKNNAPAVGEFIMNKQQIKIKGNLKQALNILACNSGRYSFPEERRIKLLEAIDARGVITVQQAAADVENSGKINDVWKEIYDWGKPGKLTADIKRLHEIGVIVGVAE